MKDYEVRHAESGTFITTILGVSHVLEAKDEFARQKGYKSWGKYYVQFQSSRSGPDQPPYSFTRIDHNDARNS